MIPPVPSALPVAGPATPAPDDASLRLLDAQALALDRTAWLALLRADQHRRWRRGQRLPAEAYLQRLSALGRDSDTALDLILSEMLLRAELGETVEAEEYAARFPQFAQPLRRQIELQGLLGSTDMGPESSLLDRNAASTRQQANVPPTLEVDRAARPEGPRFRVLRLHARGGLGEVHIAFDAELGREVALKEIQAPRADDPASRIRFVREAEVTGRLEHPGVVPVYSLGRHADGRPYYAMRLVQGDTLHEAIQRFHVADEARRDPGERALAFRGLLARFVAVCQAAAYAHSKGVLHRDLKPANILLGPYGETLLVDWGLAKQNLTAEGAEQERERASSSAPSAVSPSKTLPGDVLGTPAYMSPEQAAGALDQLGPASDVYGLGATLYHLLTGGAAFQGTNVRELLQRVRRGTFLPPRAVKTSVPRALEVICLKAMAHQPADRYASAQELAAELEHWLADEPVAAFREPLAARLARWVRRHRAAASAVTAVLLAALLGLTVGVILLGRANARTQEQSDRAERNASEAREQEAKAKEAAAEAKAVNKFLTEDLLAEAAPDKNPRSKQVTVEELLDRAALKVVKGFPEQPLVEASLRKTLAFTYWRLGQLGKGEAQARKALEMSRRLRGPDDPETLDTVDVLGLLLMDQEKLAEAEPLYRQGVEACRRVRGPDHPDTLTAQHNLAVVLEQQGKLAEAEPLFRQGFEARCRVQGLDHPYTLATLNSLGGVLMEQGKLAEAEPFFRQTLEIGRRLQGPEHPDTLSAMNNLAVLLMRRGKLADAEPLFRQSLEISRRVLGPDHPDALFSPINLATLLQEQGKLAEAEVFARDALTHAQKGGPQAQPMVLRILGVLGSVLIDHGKAAEAEPLLRECLDGRRKTLPAGHWRTAEAETLLGSCLAAQKKFADAEPLLLAGNQNLQKAQGSTEEELAKARRRLVRLYEAWGRSAEAARWQHAPEARPAPR
jgi:Tfp pilus assembly protein PilF/tRNA A-37 threonylcarbamoyl transferase component Bud32